MLSVKTNTPVLQALNNLKNAQKRMGGAMDQLSSGLRVNSAADDAAGQAIANRMTANIRAADKLTQGISDGIGLMQVAEGALGSINDILQRSRQLAVQAANGTLSGSDRASLDGEYQELLREVTRIAKSTEAFGKHPLAPSIPEPEPAKLGNTPHVLSKFPEPGKNYTFSSGIVPVAYLPAGAEDFTLNIDSLGADDDIQIFTRDGRHLVGTPLLGSDADAVWKARSVTDTASAQALVLLEDNGFLPGATYVADDLLEGGAVYDLNGSATGTYNGMTFTYSGDGDRYEEGAAFNDGSNGPLRNERVTISGQTTEDLLILVVGSGAFTANATWSSMPVTLVTPPPPPPPFSTDTTIAMSAGFGDGVDSVTVKATPSDAKSLGLEGSALDPLSMARDAMTKLQAAIGKLDGYRSQYGALSNRFEGAIQNLASESLNTTGARSRIMDADYARAAAELVRTQILQQAGTAVMSQGMQSPQAVLNLLRQ